MFEKRGFSSILVFGFRRIHSRGFKLGIIEFWGIGINLVVHYL